MENWLVTYKQQSIKLADLPRAQVDLIKQEQEKPTRRLQLDEMEEGRQREARCISNYFNMPSIATFAQTLITAAKALRIDPRPIMDKIGNAKIKLPSTSLEKAQQTQRARIQLCFSRRWRQLQMTIYLLVQQYQTPQRNLRTRVLVINQRGLILQTLSNIISLKTFVFLGKALQTSYTRLQNLVILEPHSRTANIDHITLLRATLPAVNVVLVSYGDRAKLQGLQIGDLVGGGSFYIMESEIKLSVFRKLDIILWYVQQNDQQILRSLLLGLVDILKCELYVSNCFKDLQYGHHQFNQKQFLLRLFSFYFNFFVLGMESCSEGQMKSFVLDECTEQLLARQRELDERGSEDKVHSFSTMATSLHCPVCRRRSKITCLTCCADFGSKFAICEIGCFEKFHQNRIAFAGKINKRIPNGEKEQQETEGKEEEGEPTLARVQTIQQLRGKWRTSVEGYQKDFDHFMLMTQMNFIPRKFVDRVQLLRVKIKQVRDASYQPLQTFLKEEQ